MRDNGVRLPHLRQESYVGVVSNNVPVQSSNDGVLLNNFARTNSNVPQSFPVPVTQSAFVPVSMTTSSSAPSSQKLSEAKIRLSKTSQKLSEAKCAFQKIQHEEREDAARVEAEMDAHRVEGVRQLREFRLALNAASLIEDPEQRKATRDRLLNARQKLLYELSEKMSLNPRYGSF